MTWLCRGNCKVVGYLYDDPDPQGRGQDMVEIRLPNGIVIDAGWYPEGDPNGRYRIAFHQGAERLRENVGTQDIDELARKIERYVGHYLTYVPTTTNIDHDPESAETESETVFMKGWKTGGPRLALC